jgi:hypothetical protein
MEMKRSPLEQGFETGLGEVSQIRRHEEIIDNVNE